MALVAARGFSGGPMSDIDYGMVASPAAWVETPGALAVSQPNTGTRSVAIAPGWHDGFGIRQNNDAAITQALAAPSSGGAWYLIALRRDWAAKTCTLQVLAGPTTGGTAAPTYMPTSVPADLKSTPGTQHDQPLAWAFVNSANTTVTLFDLRLQHPGINLQASTFEALAFASTSLPNGAIVALGRCVLPGGSVHQYSTWQRVEGAMLPVGGSAIMVSAVGSIPDALTASDAIAAVQAAYPSALSWYQGQRLRADSLGIELRWSASLRDARYWRVWECEWINFRTSEGGATASPGAPNTCRARVQGGLCYFEWQGTIQNTSGDQFTLSLGALPSNPFSRGNGPAGQPFGACFMGNGANTYPLLADWNAGQTGANVMTFSILQNSQWVQAKGQGPVNMGGMSVYVNQVWNPNS